MQQTKLSVFFTHFFLGITAFFSLFPFLWMVISASNTHLDVVAGRLLPGKMLFENFVTLFSDTEILNAFGNSVIVTFGGVALTVLFSSMAAYGFEFFPTKVNKKIYSAFILSMMIPFSALMIPMFQLSAAFGLINTFVGLIITTILNVFLIFFFRQSFKAMPISLIEAARIDGENEISIFFKIVFPVLKTTFAAGTIFAFIGSWNNYLWPLIFMQSSDKFTLPIFLSNMANGYVIDYSIVMCAIIVSTLPVLIIFIFLQKHFVNGMMGSIK